MSIRDTPAANVIDDLLEQIAQGNKGYSEFEKFELNGTIISFRAKLRHWHRLRGPLGSFNLYKVDTFIDGEFDITKPADADLEFTVNTPVGPVSFDLTDVATAAAGMIA